MLAGSIVQVRPERKALNAEVSPTCCSGREQRSKTAHAGSAISINSQKTALRNRLRAGRRELAPGEHKLKSRKAARAILRVAQFAAGLRVAIYLPFDHETD